MAIKYKWLASQLEVWMKHNLSKGIDKLPSEEALCKKYNVSRQTVRMALSLLSEKHLIEKRHGSGSYITALSDNASENIIAILLTEDEEYIYPALINDLTNQIEKLGFAVQLHITHNRFDKERLILEELIASPPRGLLVEGTKSAYPNPNLPYYETLYQNKCPILFLHNYYPNLPQISYVKDANQQGASLLMQHLIKQGHKKIAGIFTNSSQQGMERAQGYLLEQSNHALPFCDEYLLFVAEETDFINNPHLNPAQLNDCTAFLCQNDRIAYALLLELRQRGYQVPKEYAIVSFDNTYLSESRILTLTSLTHKPHEITEKAVQTLLSKIKGLPVTSQEVPWTLVEKASSPLI